MADFMSFADEVRNNSGTNGRRSCGVSDLLQSLPGDDADKVQEVLMDRAVSAQALHDALKRRLGSDAPSQYTIQRHRRRSCFCFVETK